MRSDRSAITKGENLSKKKYLMAIDINSKHEAKFSMSGRNG